MTALVLLPEGFHTWVDLQDLWHLARFSFRAVRAQCASRANCYVRGGGHLLHRLIIRPGGGFVVDHINHDGLDNRRRNLRAVTQSQNVKNRSFGRDAPLSVGLLPPGVPVITREALKACGPDRLALAELVAAAPLSLGRAA